MVVTLPGGEVQRFKAQAIPECKSSLEFIVNQFWELGFEPIGDTTAELEQTSYGFLRVIGGHLVDLRLEFEGALYHVTSRGDRREAIYESDEDRSGFLELLGAVCDRYNWVCHAYCLMGNHYHLLIETPDANLSRGMRHLNGVYTQNFNRAHRRVGHVFQGRYKAIVVDGDAYLTELARYVVLNPVRAKMVEKPQDWAWSSYAATLNRRLAPDWLEVDGLLSSFGGSRKTAVARYRRFVMAGIGKESPWNELRCQVYLGDERFLEAMQDKLKEQAGELEIPRAQRRPAAKPLEYYEQEGASRADAMRAAYASGAYTLQEIALNFVQDLTQCPVSTFGTRQLPASSRPPQPCPSCSGQYQEREWPGPISRGPSGGRPGSADFGEPTSEARQAPRSHP